MAKIVKKCGCDCATQTNACGCDCAPGLQCQTQGGIASIKGFQEFTSPSIPPKKFLEEVFSGTGDTSGYFSSDCSGGAYCSNVGTNAGSRIYNPNADTIADSGTHTVSGSCDGTGTTAITDIVGGGEGDVLVVARTTKTITNDLTCHATGVATSEKRLSSPSYKMELQNEDTEDKGITRLLASSPLSGWRDYDPLTCSDCCTGGWQYRLTGFSWFYKKLWWRFSNTRLQPNTHYQLSVTIEQRAYGSTDEWTIQENQIIEFTTGEADVGSSLATYATASQDVPIYKGYDVRIKGGCVTSKITL